MKKFYLLRLLGCLFFALTPLAPARAQWVSPWFRGTPQSWQTLTQVSFSAPGLNAARLSVPLSGLSTGYAVKTTVPNWLTHRLSHSNTFSRMEKDLFKIHPTNLAAVSGKLSYFWDRNALLGAAAAPGEINQNAFNRHQELLQNTLAEVENFAKEQIVSQFNSPLFSQEELSLFLKDSSQPPAFVLTRREVEVFPTLSLAEQQAFARNTWQNTSNQLARLLRQNPQDITTQIYSDYYYLKLRQRYFAALCQVMNSAQTPRHTIVIRIRKKIPLSFLPESDQPLTDAQRLGKLYFHRGLMTENNQLSMEESVALQTELARQNELYYAYAAAEAFGLPYEQVLRYRNYPATVYFSEEEAARINLLTSHEAVDELPQQIADLQEQMKQFIRTKAPSPEAYTRYFRLAAQEEYLKMRLTQAKFFSQYRP